MPEKKQPLQHLLKNLRPVVRSVVALSLWLALLVAPTPVSASDEKSFRDDFNSLDRARWYESDGWANGEYQNCIWSKRAVSIRDGILSLSFLRQFSAQRDYICAEIQTRTEHHYGTFEVRMRTETGSGLNAAFFTYIGPNQQKPHDEIDVEVLTRDTSKVSLNTYVSGSPRYGSVAPLLERSDSTFKTYAFIWEKNRLRWFVDGRLVHEAVGDDLPVTPQRIFLSYWGSDTLKDWMGPFADPGVPLTLRVDWVAYTALGDPCAFPESVLCTLK